MVFGRIGRFLQADPYAASGTVANPSSWNRYRYVRDDPVNCVDPDARAPINPEEYFRCLVNIPHFYWEIGGEGGQRRVELCLNDSGVAKKKPSSGSSMGPDRENVDSRPDCPERQKRFFSNIELYEDMVRKLQIDADYLLTLSSYESGWLDNHNYELRNLFGVTQAVAEVFDSNHSRLPLITGSASMATLSEESRAVRRLQTYFSRFPITLSIRDGEPTSSTKCDGSTSGKDTYASVVDL